MSETRVPASRLRAAASVTHGAELTFETVVAGGAPVRVHDGQDTLLRVVAGPVLLSVGDDQRVLATGDEAIVPAGRPHRVVSVGVSARIVTGLRRAA